MSGRVHEGPWSPLDPLKKYLLSGESFFSFKRIFVFPTVLPIVLPIELPIASPLCFRLCASDKVCGLCFRESLRVVLSRKDPAGTARQESAGRKALGQNANRPCQ